MNANAIPVIRMDVEMMKSSILHHLGVVGSELGECLDAEIEKAVSSFPWQQRVDEIVHESIDSNIKAYFQYGDGSNAIKLVINEAISKHLA